MLTNQDITKLKTVFVTKKEFKNELKQLATKKDLERYATKKDLEKYATKEALEDLRNDTANGFLEAAQDRALIRQEMKAGFKMVMRELKIMRKELQYFKGLERRVQKLEYKTSLASV